MSTTIGRLAGIWQPHSGQAAFLENASRIKVLACGRRWGKTDACAAQIVLSFFESSPTKHVVLAPTQDQANLLFERAIEMLRLVVPEKKLEIRRTPYPRLNCLGHRLTARSGHLARALRGNEATHLIVDEAAFVPEEVITQVAMPMLATTNGQMTLISTPCGKNHFWKFFQFGQTGEHGVWSHTAPSSESPYVSKQFLEIQKSLISARAYRVEYEADFLDAEGQVFRTEAVEACIKSQLPDLVGPIFIGIDWGRRQDTTAVAVLRGTLEQAELLELPSWSGLSWPQMAAHAASVVRQYPTARVLCDATGVGDPVCDMVRALAPERFIEGLDFTATNKLLMVDRLAAMFENERIALLPHPELQRELHHYEETLSLSGGRTLGAPPGFHDDRVTALMLAVHALDQLVLGRALCGRTRSLALSEL